MQQQSGGTVNNFNLNLGGGGETNPPSGYPSVEVAYHDQASTAHMSAGYNTDTQTYTALEPEVPAQSRIAYQDQTQQEQSVVVEQNTYIENNYVDNSAGSTTHVDNSAENTYIDASTDNTTNVSQNQYQDNSTAIDNTNNYVDESEYSEQAQYAEQNQYVDEDQYVVEQGQYTNQAQGVDEGDTWTDTGIQQEEYYGEEQQTLIVDESGNGGWGDSTGYDGEGYGDWNE
jgi:hypothetical protein